MKTNETEVRTAGSCDCLIIDEKWRFLEFKTEVLGKSFNNFSYAEKVAEQNRNKAEMQLARTMTFFKEQAQGKLLNLPSPFEAVLVVNSQFPSTNSEIILRRARFITRFETDLKEVVAEGTKYEQEQSRGYLID